jgi:hypothetical protein
MTRIQVYSLATVSANLWLPLLAVAQPMGGTQIPEIATPVNNVLATVTNVIGPAVGICGLMAAGACFVMGQTGRVFQIALGVTVGGVLISQAANLWHTFFGATT